MFGSLVQIGELDALAVALVVSRMFDRRPAGLAIAGRRNVAKVQDCDNLYARAR
jgi:hypothetical protein